MKTDFMIKTMNEQALGEMKLEVKRKINIINVNIEQILYNNMSKKEIQMDKEGNVLKYSFLTSDWMNKKEEFSYEYLEQEKAYYDLKENAYLRIKKQKVFESFYVCPQFFLKEENGEIKIFDFKHSMQTSLIYKSWSVVGKHYIQITVPVCVKMEFNKNMELDKYKDESIKIQCI